MAMGERQELDYNDSKERLSKEDREMWLNERLADLVHYAYQHAPAVMRRLDEAGVRPDEIKTVKDLEKIPVMSKGELLRWQRANPPFGGFLTVPVSSLRRVFISPGPIYDVYEPDRIKALVKAIRAAGFAKPGDIVLCAGSFHMVPAGLLFTAVFDLMGVTVVPTGPGQTSLQVQIAHELKATGFVGFPSFLMSMIKEAERMGYDFRRDFNIKWALGMGERHLQMLRKEFEEKYGIEICQLYGTADVGILTSECEYKDGMHFNDEDAIIEVVDPKTHQQLPPYKEGEVVVTLLSKIYPLIRLGTGDLSSYVDDICPCGRTSPRLTAITGMIGDHVRTKGMFIHSRELDEAMSFIPEVSKYQMVLSLTGHKDLITLRLEVSGEPISEILSERVRERCKETFRVKIDQINVVPTGTIPDGYQKFIDERFGKPKES
jgi:phenylacetate-CoA ligase